MSTTAITILIQQQQQNCLQLCLVRVRIAERTCNEKSVTRTQHVVVRQLHLGANKITLAVHLPPIRGRLPAKRERLIDSHDDTHGEWTNCYIVSRPPHYDARSRRGRIGTAWFFRSVVNSAPMKSNILRRARIRFSRACHVVSSRGRV